MTSPHESWKQLSESEIEKLMEDIISKLITFASNDQIQEHGETANRFIKLSAWLGRDIHFR